MAINIDTAIGHALFSIITSDRKQKQHLDNVNICLYVLEWKTRRWPEWIRKGVCVSFFVQKEHLGDDNNDDYSLSWISNWSIGAGPKFFFSFSI